ncbi:MAG: serine/threonine-protein kinase [Thermoanaerobaculia bacterium]
MQCSSCHATLPADARFCLRCGVASPGAGLDEPVDPLRETLKVALGRQYDVLKLLGRGGMGAVYLAREAALEREVAIKVLPPDRGDSQESRDRFRREARTAARLSHPNIVPLLTFGDVEGTMFFVMGYVPGESLAAKLKRDGPLPIDEARRIVGEVAEALSYAHGAGVVHRDIKPDNVLIDAETGRAMLTDFGIAKSIGGGETMTAQGGLIGTPQYMSPEQAEGRRDIDARSDLYSLGVMGYLMLSGRLPFEGASAGDVLLQHITREAPPLKSVAPGVPAEMAMALMRCLCKDPAMRWQDAKALRAALAPAPDDEVPVSLEGVQGLALASLGSLLFLSYLGLWALGGGDATATFAVLATVNFSALSLVFLAVLAEKAWRAGKQGFERHRILLEIFKQPGFWTGAYPRRYRARSDVWDRLPEILKRARNGMAGWIVGSGLLMIPSLVLREAWDSYLARTGMPLYPKGIMNGVSWALLGTCVALFANTLFRAGKWDRWAREHGVSDPNLRSHAMGYSTTKSTFWEKPEIAALLASVGTRSERAATVPESPQEIAAALSAIVQRLDASAFDLGVRASEAARRLIASIEALDREIGLLAGTFQPLERDRLVQKLAALAGPASDGSQGEVRGMLQRQLELLQDLERRMARAQESRAKRVEVLRMLWLQAAQLPVSTTVSKDDQTARRISAICQEIGEYVATVDGSPRPSIQGEEEPTLDLRPRAAAAVQAQALKK